MARGSGVVATPHEGVERALKRLTHGSVATRAVFSGPEWRGHVARGSGLCHNSSIDSPAPRGGLVSARLELRTVLPKRMPLGGCDGRLGRTPRVITRKVR